MSIIKQFKKDFVNMKIHQTQELISEQKEVTVNNSNGKQCFIYHVMEFRIKLNEIIMTVLE